MGRSNPRGPDDGDSSVGTASPSPPAPSRVDTGDG